VNERFRAKVAVHVFLVREGSVLLLRRANTGYEDGNYSVPAGHLEGDETATAAAAREVLEEAGVVIDADGLTFAGVMHRRANDERIDFFFEARAWDGELTNAEPEKCDELAWYEFDDLPPNVVAYVRRAIENYRAGILFDGFGWE
jgi:8-oxo-dGTP diphosphatase